MLPRPLSEECKAAIRVLIDEIGTLYDIDQAYRAIFRVQVGEIVLMETYNVMQSCLAEFKHHLTLTPSAN